MATIKTSEMLLVKAFREGIGLTEYVDITDGIISVDTKTGNDYYEGEWSQPDSGQFTIVSRNPDLDPNESDLIRVNTKISIGYKHYNDAPEYWNESNRPVLNGYVTGFDVQYITNDNPIITITGTDFVGNLNRTILDDNFFTTYPDYAENELVDLETFLWIFNIGYYYGDSSFGLVTSGGVYVKFEKGKSVWEIMSKALETYNLSLEYGLFTDLSYGWHVKPNPKYDMSYRPEPNFMDNYDDEPFAKYHFTSNPEDIDIPEFNFSVASSYKRINIGDGFDRTINFVNVNNTDPVTNINTSHLSLQDTASSNEWGVSQFNASTQFSVVEEGIGRAPSPYWLTNATIQDQVDQYQIDIIEQQSQPEIEIVSITLDMEDVVQDYADQGFAGIFRYYQKGESVYILHKISETKTIKGLYKIIGVKNQITRNNWTAEIIVKKDLDYLVSKKIPKKPIIELNIEPTLVVPPGEPEYSYYEYQVGPNTPLTATITNYSAEELEDIEKIEWFVNNPTGFYAAPSQIKQYIERINSDPEDPWLFEGYNFLNTPIITTAGTSLNFTYSPLGILDGYDTAITGPGYYEVSVYITNKNGWIQRGDLDSVVAVTGQDAHADFTTTVNEYGLVTITELSGPDTTTWSWNFGDGTTYSGHNPPQKTYAAPGTYNITLTVNNGFDSDTITKPVTIVEALLPVRYVKLRFQGTVTKAAGQANYTTDLIDTFGSAYISNTLSQTNGQGMPFYLKARTLDKVQLIKDSWVRPTPYKYDNWENPLIIDTPGYYESTGLLNPMQMLDDSQGPRSPKYKFHPIITNNPDGSQTKTYDFDLIFDYSKIYAGDLVYYRRFGVADEPMDWFWVPGGNASNIINWPQWGPAPSTAYNQKYKMDKIIVYPGQYTELIEDNFQVIDKFGHNTNRTYLPVTVSVSPDGNTYRTVGTLNFISGSTAMTGTYSVPMPPKNTAPIQTP